MLVWNKRAFYHGTASFLKRFNSLVEAFVLIWSKVNGHNLTILFGLSSVFSLDGILKGCCFLILSLQLYRHGIDQGTQRSCVVHQLKAKTLIFSVSHEIRNSKREQAALNVQLNLSMLIFQSSYLTHTPLNYHDILKITRFRMREIIKKQFATKDKNMNRTITSCHVFVLARPSLSFRHIRLTY